MNEPFLGAPNNVLHPVGKDLSRRGQISSCCCSTGRVCGQSGPRPVRQPYAWIWRTEVRSGRQRDGRADRTAGRTLGFQFHRRSSQSRHLKSRLRSIVVPRDALPITGFIRVRGLPQFVSINDSHAIAPGSWGYSLVRTTRAQDEYPDGPFWTYRGRDCAGER